MWSILAGSLVYVSYRPVNRLVSAVTAFCRFPQQDFGWDSKLLGQTTYHRVGQLPIPGHHLVNSRPRTEHSNQRFGIQTHLIESKVNRIDGIGHPNGKALVFVRINQGDEHIEAVAIRRSGARSP